MGGGNPERGSSYEFQFHLEVWCIVEYGRLITLQRHRQTKFAWSYKKKPCLAPTVVTCTGVFASSNRNVAIGGAGARQITAYVTTHKSLETVLKQVGTGPVYLTEATEVDLDGLNLCVVGKSCLSEFTSETRLLETSEWQR